MNLFAISSLLCSAFCFILAIFSFIAGKNLLYKLVGWCNVTICIWGLGGFIVAIAPNSGIALLGWKIAHMGGFFVSSLFYHIVSKICEVKRPKFILFAYLQAIFYNLINLPTDWMMKPIRMAFGFFYIDRTIFSSLAFTTYFFIVVMSYIELSHFLKAARGYKRQQALYICYGFAAAFLGGTSILLSEFRIDILYPVGNLGVFIYAAVVTYAILRNQILDFQQIAQAAHRDKLAAMGTLASSMNHEVRNPLFVMRGIADTYLTDLEEGIYKDPQEAIRQAKESFSKMTQQIQRASDIMKNFSSFAKQNIAENFRFERVNLKKVLDSVIPLVKYELERDEVRMEMDVPADLHVQADTRHLEEIFFNLIVNACQAMKSTPVEKRSIKIKAKEESQKVIITVADNGPGIPEEHIKNVFKPFYTTKEDGTGLGLFITKQLIDRCHGRISVESQSGRGTTFILEFKQ